MMKWKTILWVTVLTMVCLLAPAAFASEEMGTLVKVNQYSQWLQGTLTDAVYNSANSNEIILNQDSRGYLSGGTYTSAIYTTTLFNRLVPSWIAATPFKTNVKVDIQLRVNNTWTIWYPLGVWDSNYTSASSSGSDSYGYTSIDTIIVRNGYKADAFRFRITLQTKDRAVTPILKYFAVTAFDESLPPATPIQVNPGWLTELPVPMRSQMIEDAKVSGSICSPTSLSMVLEYYGMNRTTKQIYDLVYDNGAKIYGNWPFNTAVAGSFGREAYVDYFFHINEVKNKIAAGIPVICSISFAAGQLDGAPISSTAGHLLVVRGFVIRDNQEYVICNDPAAPDNASVRREYKVEQFINAWKGWVYIVK